MKTNGSSSVLKLTCRIVFVSALLWGALLLAWAWHSRQRQALAWDPRFVIRDIAVRSQGPDQVPNHVLCSLLGLGASPSTSLFAFHPDAWAQKLLQCPSFAKAKVWRLLPGTLGIEYRLRDPVACIAGASNIGIDGSGRLFFLTPYFAPRRLPSILLPAVEAKTLAELQEKVAVQKEAKVALSLVNELSRMGVQWNFAVASVDLVHYREKNAFRREVVLVLADLSSGMQKLYIRCASQRLAASVKRLPRLLQRLMVSKAFRPGTIDLRYPGCALLFGEIKDEWKKDGTGP